MNLPAPRGREASFRDIHPCGKTTGYFVSKMNLPAPRGREASFRDIHPCGKTTGYFVSKIDNCNSPHHKGQAFPSPFLSSLWQDHRVFCLKNEKCPAWIQAGRIGFRRVQTAARLAAIWRRVSVTAASIGRIGSLQNPSLSDSSMTRGW